MPSPPSGCTVGEGAWLETISVTKCLLVPCFATSAKRTVFRAVPASPILTIQFVTCHATRSLVSLLCGCVHKYGHGCNR
eukprot:3946163-Pleurochrysis_carterae.AAC.3